MNYIVEQGVFTKSGSGDMTHVEYFDDLQSAKSHFNKIYSDTNGWVHNKGDLLVTELVKVVEFDEEYDEIIDTEIIDYESVLF